MGGGEPQSGNALLNTVYSPCDSSLTSFFKFFFYKCGYRASNWSEEEKKELGAREVDKGITRLEANMSGVTK